MKGQGAIADMINDEYISAMERQLGLWGKEGQMRLRGARVAIAGLGGIGAASALMLAKAGVGSIRVCDWDHYDSANIVGQEFATHDDIGRPKVEVALEVMNKHTKHSVLEGFQADLKLEEECKRLIADACILVSAVDNAPARIALGRAADKAGIPFVVSANIGWTATHTVYFPGNNSYKQAWNAQCLKYLEDGYPDMDDPETASAIKEEWDIWVAVFSGFAPAAMRQFIEKDSGSYWYAPPPAYFAASLGINDVLKIITGSGEPVIYPKGIFYNLISNKYWEWNILIKRYNALRQVWSKGPEAILSVMREMN